MDNPVAQTAVGPVAIVAIDQHEDIPLVRSDVAYWMLPASGRLIATLTRIPVVRRLLINAAEKKIPGLWASMLCRKRYINDQIRDAVRAGVETVVVLGAGLDDCAYRLRWLSDTVVFEVDLPKNISRKRALLKRLYGKVPDHVRLVPIDFETGDLNQVLAEHGHRNDDTTAFVWEAVTQYLTETAVRRTLDALATAAGGSRLVFTYVRRDFLDGAELYGGEALYREYVVERRLWRFGMDPGEVAGFLSEYGWRLTDDAGPREFADRYLQPTCRELTASEVERSACAEKV
ncbi:SAM-dependent methyltransferase [Saccharopolyspora erythraea]|uniref:SAM-dependent methyltransferase n=1 Tax=Saccharopolyspora erythraea TaxID=1836 RepID=UPI001BA45683|nr:SAM-dependent methyltransferase [Saccharopolyspora erythraea]QUH06294.1 SAM-dependent methyltransferase [Saccharopolyspora erythraea]